MSKLATDTTDDAAITKKIPYWLSPCGLPITINNNNNGNKASSNGTEATFDSEKELYESIITIANIALEHTKSFRENYVQQTFQLDFWDHHNNWKTHKYQWIWDNIQLLENKELGDQLLENKLEGLNEQNEALNVYNLLQILAVGFEQVINDMQQIFKDKFQIIEYNLRELLCALRDIIPEEKWTDFQNPTRDIMPKELKNIDISNRNIRDWLIFRDYMNVLEYLIQFLEFILKTRF